MRFRYFLLAGLGVIMTGCSLFKSSTKPFPKPEMIYIRGGTFQMGNQWDSLNTDALPVHTVTVDGFYMGQYEITRSQFNAYAKRTGRSVPYSINALTHNIPATKISWNEAKAYCQHFGFRLPTEQEWEYAARAGGKKMKFSGTSNPDSLYRYAYVDKPQASRPLPVGLKKPNALGLYDMSGNVFEWVGDYYQIYPEKGTKPDWDDFDQRILRIIRGGSFDQPASVASTFWRAGMLHDGRASDVGFRCAADADQSLSAISQ